ncbi:Uncharacterised protein [Streptococcus pneumoniae]|nr:Uncharacterised protein [Streptococcus pneumoniae]
MTNLLFVSYSSKISSNHVNAALPCVWLLTSSVLSTTSKQWQKLLIKIMIEQMTFIEVLALKS